MDERLAATACDAACEAACEAAACDGEAACEAACELEEWFMRVKADKPDALLYHSSSRELSCLRDTDKLEGGTEN